MQTPAQINTALTAVGREPISEDRAQLVCNFLANDPERNEPVLVPLFEVGPDEIRRDVMTYRTALAEAADPQLLVRRLTWEAEQLDRRAEYHAAHHVEFAAKAVAQPWHAEGEGGFSQRARGSDLCAQECRANAALKRADAEAVLRCGRRAAA